MLTFVSMTRGAACPTAEEDKSSSEHSSAEGRGHVSEASLALEPWAFVAQGVTGAAIERPFAGVLEDVLDASRKGDPGSSPG